MPRLIEYISIGTCAGYGDGDFRVSAAIRDMTKKQFDELKLTTLSALICAEDMWRSAQAKQQGAMEKYDE